MIIYGVPQYYYGKASFWPEDTVILSSDKFSSDTFMTLEYGKKNILRYTKDLMRDSIPVYRIDVKIATGLIPQKSMIAELVNNIAKCKTLNVINQ